jgi:hypothetical protein
MRRLYTLFIIASLSLTGAMAQNGTGIVGDGYYRVHNKTTGRYIYVTDNKDYYNESTDTEDFQAIQLWSDANKAISDPATVIYIEQHGNKYDLLGQGTGVHELTDYYVTITKITTPGANKGTYQVSASRGNVTRYLTDDRASTNPRGLLGTGTDNSDAKYRLWVIDKIETNSASNYFGIKPTIELNGKYYQPFYASFPFKTVSPNMHVYYVSKVASNIATLTEIEGVIPDNTAVIIECSSNTPADNRIEILNPTSAKIQGNKLKGVYFCNDERPQESTDAYKEFKASTMRLLTKSNGKLVFSNNAPDRLNTLEIFDWSTFNDINIDCIPANTCYMEASAGTPAVLDIRFEGVGIDEILAENKDASAEGVYTLSGTQLRKTNDVQGLPAGLYIVGGVKVVVK